MIFRYIIGKDDKVPYGLYELILDGHGKYVWIFVIRARETHGDYLTIYTEHPNYYKIPFSEEDLYED